MPLPLKHFYMIRHGETEANEARIMAGSLDSPLNDTGKAQARTVQNIVKKLEVKPTVIVHSNLSRARNTAAIINEALDVPMYEEPDIAELHAGDWEGVPYDECHDLLTGWPDPPNGETFADFTKRIQRGKTKILTEHDGPVLMVSHGGVFRAFGGLYGLSTPGVFRNCHLHELAPAEKAHDYFPWDVWSYRFENHVHRDHNTVFHDSPRLNNPNYKADKIA